MLRQVLIATVLFTTAAPSFAQDTTTLQYILAKGVVIHADLYGRPVDMFVTYNPDGSSIASIIAAKGKVADVAGKWRIDGDRFCTVNEMNPEENCFDVPAGKKPGDVLNLMTPAMGQATLTINQ